MRADSTPWQPGWDWRCGNLVHCYMPVRPTHFKDGSAFGRTVGGKDTGREEGRPPGSPPQHSGDRFYSTEFRVVRCKETRLEGPPCVGNRQGFPRKLSRTSNSIATARKILGSYSAPPGNQICQEIRFHGTNIILCHDIALCFLTIYLCTNVSMYNFLSVNHLYISNI